MKLIAFLLAFLSAFMAVAAVDVQKSFLVSFDSNTDDSVVEKAKQMIIDAKGTITHEYRLIKCVLSPADPGHEALPLSLLSL